MKFFLQAFPYDALPFIPVIGCPPTVVQASTRVRSLWPMTSTPVTCTFLTATSVPRSGWNCSKIRRSRSIAAFLTVLQLLCPFT